MTRQAISIKNFNIFISNIIGILSLITIQSQKQYDHNIIQSSIFQSYPNEKALIRAWNYWFIWLLASILRNMIIFLNVDIIRFHIYDGQINCKKNFEHSVNEQVKQDTNGFIYANINNQDCNKIVNHAAAIIEQQSSETSFAELVYGWPPNRFTF